MTPAAARRSIERSLELLGAIDLLQIHKASSELFRSDIFPALMDVVQDYGIPALGVSVNDLESFRLARSSAMFSYFQFPFNRRDAGLGEILDLLAGEEATPLINRPMAMGALAQGAGSAGAKARALRDSFEFVLAPVRSGVILTGTGSLDHLRENVEAFDSIVAAS